MRARGARTIGGALVAAIMLAFAPAGAQSGVVHYHTWDFEYDINLDGATANAGGAHAGSGTADVQALAGGLLSLKLVCLGVEHSGATTTIRAVGVDAAPASGLPQDENWSAVQPYVFRLQLTSNSLTKVSSFGLEEIAPGPNAPGCSGWSVSQRPAIGYQYFWVAGA